jgi:nucleolar protein 58
MLVLYETPAGYALFSVRDEGKLENLDDLSRDLEDPKSAKKILKLKAFSKFENTSEALEAATAIIDGTLSKDLKKFLKKNVGKEGSEETLAVGDAKLGGVISKKLGIQVVSDSTVMELMRGIRSQVVSLVDGLSEGDMKSMSLGLSHSLSRHKIKFSPEKVDTMIIQAIALLDDLDKELNTYAMRLKEWYGWHFPELARILVDSVAFARVINTVGFRTATAETDLTAILPEELIVEIKAAAEISMGTEISQEDLDNIKCLADQVISISEYRAELFDYLKNRMMAIAPNLTAMVGELVGARLISRAGSLMNLAKYPASTVQVLGAEKALFRAIKTKHDTPKYGLIYHASLVGQAGPKLKGKISRVLAARTALSVRVDALSEDASADVGIANRIKVENRLRQLEGRSKSSISASAKGKTNQQKFQLEKVQAYNPATDFTPSKIAQDKKLKRKVEEVDEQEEKKSESSSDDDSEAETKKSSSKKSKSEKKDKKKDKKDKKDKKEKKSKKNDSSSDSE